MPTQKLSDEALRSFVTELFRIPIYSAAHEKARLSQDTRVIWYAAGYYAVRVFPILTEESAKLIKESYRSAVEEMIAGGDLELVKQLPISLEDMAGQTVREMKATPVWRLENVPTTHKYIGGYELKAMRYAADPVTLFPCVMLTYEREKSANIEVYLIAASLTDAINKLLLAIQMAEDKLAPQEGVSVIVQAVGVVAEG
jgi:hypothetical protein